MLWKKAFIAACAGATFCAAQSINIQGTVRDSAGVAISGATVKLEATNLSTVTGPDGGFILAGTPATIRPRNGLSSRPQSPIALHHGQIRISLAEKALVALSVHNVGGRRILSSERIYDAGTHILPAHSSVTGMSLYRVAIGQDEYTLESSSFGSFSGEANRVSQDASRPLSKRAKTSAVYRGVISIKKEGWIDYRDSIRTSDTTGIVIIMIPNAGNVTDADGNVYQSVRIGSQVWTVENLKTTKYNDGAPIPHVAEHAEWDSLKTGAYCYYGNDPVNKDRYGALYHWFAVRTGKLAPVGWHVPTPEEWETLQNYLVANGYNWDGTTTGNKVGKSLAAKTDWAPDTTAGFVGNDPSSNNATGFSGLPGGRRQFASEDLRFNSMGDHGYWWSSEPELPDNIKAWNYFLNNAGGRLYQSVHYFDYAFSVRLVRDN